MEYRDVYNDPSEAPTVPMMRISPLGVSIAQRLEELELTGVKITDELILSIVEEERAKYHVNT